MRALIAILLLLPFAALKIVLVIVSGLLYYCCYKWIDNHRPPMFFRAEGDARYNADRVDNHNDLVRNPVGGMAYWFGQPPKNPRPPDLYYDFPDVAPPTFRQYGYIEPNESATMPRLQARFRRYSWLCSMRAVVRWSGKRYSEVYVGWKLNGPEDREQRQHMDFALSVRPWARIGA